MKFGDEIYPTLVFADNKKRRFIFMSWMGGKLNGYARIATILLNSDGFDEQGVWIKNLGLVLQEDHYVFKDNIRKFSFFGKIKRYLKEKLE